MGNLQPPPPPHHGTHCLTEEQTQKQLLVNTDVVRRVLGVQKRKEKGRRLPGGAGVSSTKKVTF